MPMRTLALLATIILTLAAPAAAQQAGSRLARILQSGVLRVCIWPLYYAIAMEDPTNGDIVGIDADLSNALASELGAKREIVETTFGTFTTDLQANKCDIAMFGIGATLKFAEQVAFSRPYLISGLYAVVRDGSPIRKWTDIDKKGVKVALYQDDYTERFLRAYLQNATILPPANTQLDILSQPVDVLITHFPGALRFVREFEGSKMFEPPERLAAVPFSYAIPQGDQAWRDYVNLFVETIKLDGRLAAAAARHGLSPIVAP